MSTKTDLLHPILITISALITGYFGYLFLITSGNTLGLTLKQLLSLSLVVAIGSFFLMWLTYSWLFSKLTGTDLKDSLKLDTYTYLPVFLFFIYYIPFDLPPHISGPERFKLPLGLVYISMLAMKLIFVVWNLFKDKLLKLEMRKVQAYLFFIVLISYLLIGFWTSNMIHATGDEPYYLLTAQSLIKDGDLDVSNNYTNEEYLSFYPAKLRPSFCYAGDKAYFGARVALPLLILPGFVAGGWYGASVIMNIVGAFLIVNIFLLIYEFFNDRRVALFCSIAMAFSLPLVFFSSRIYHNLPAALLVVFVFRKIHNTSKDYTSFQLLGISILISLLPWLHESYTIVTVALFIMLLLKQGVRPRQMPSIFLPPMVLGGLYLYLHKMIFGYFFIDPRYHGAFTWRIYRSFLALFFDQECGLFFFAPLYLLAIVGLCNFLRKGRGKIAVPAILGSLLLPQFAITAFGGEYSLARVLIPSLPFLGILVAQSFKFHTGKAFILFRNILGITTLSIAYILMAVPWLIFNNENGKNVFFEFFEKFFYLDLSPYFPTFISITPKTYMITGGYLILVSSLVFFFSEERNLG